MMHAIPPVFLDPPDKPANEWTAEERALYEVHYAQGERDRAADVPYAENVSVGWQEGWRSEDAGRGEDHEQ